ncbi:hypothetical protein PF005_g5632 [Phytophthora fragariae]|uniref:Protein kinase domain-containing protein n=1 Tax=Phytophthora fragariae TaxID=53985 RepID=A0A6A4EHG2_9STRA|nr:hypothetical protein PF003_g33470 [Phytophthora fragariae]KAE8944222.1 hypothetical protein PF009_g6087 [Phytophthora fragariae]KAE9022121.1 hypothetical protein PF011_g4612 [Phytophthora fragariae]KAE9127011.1 hypothetical protein PF007_g5760 [Phytophthora fragariae]KAE9127031.1 hypothetical protein PF010_g5063 [Phytophthora fragariae]
MRRSSLAAAAAALVGAVGRVEADSSMEIDCPKNNATLTINGNALSYLCGSNYTGDVVMDADFQVNVQASVLTLKLIGAQNVKTLNITGGDELPTLAFTQPLNMESFSELHSLRFKSVQFDPNSVMLTLPSTMKDLHVVNSSLPDLSLSSYDSSLTVIDLTGTTFYQVPHVLYEREYNMSEMDIIVDLTLINGNATDLTSQEFTYLTNNVEDDVKTSCTNYTAVASSMTVSAAESNTTVTCGSASSSSTSTASSRDYGSPTGDSTTTNDRSSSSSGEAANAGGSNGGVSTGVLVVIIVLVVVVAVVLAFVILRMYFKRKAANANSHNNEATATLMSKSDATADKGSFISNDEFLRNFRLPQSDVSLVKSVGTGRLWVGEYNGGKVVVKRVESEVTDSYVTKALMAQARTFATISHPNITSLVGVTWLAGTDFAVVTEFMDKNNLKTVLSNTDVDLDVTTKLQMCCDVALALAYLHETEQNLCAKQLSSRKVLVNNAMGCKLSLFECVPSSAKLGGPSKVTTYSYGMGEVAWLAPEVLTRSSPMDARKNNIFAFGILVSEIFTRVSPYQSLVEEKGNTMSDVELVARVRRQEPLVPHENRQEFLKAPSSVRQLVEQCLSYAPMSRPTAKDLVEVLHNAKEELATDSI